MTALHQALFAGGLVALVVTARLLLWWLTRRASAAISDLPGRAAASGLWARTHPLRAHLASRFPRAYRFAARRLEPRRISGLPLTLGAAAAVYLLALIGGLIEELLEAEELVALDQAVNALLDPLRGEPMVAAFAWLTRLGGSATLIAVVLTGTAFLWAHRRAYLILPLWVTQIGAQATTYLGKFALDRERPEFVTGVTALTPSFPSGHATGAMAVYGFLAFLIARDLPGLRERFEVVYWIAVLIAVVGFSRLYLSVHYASDVATGFLVGGFWLLVGIMLAEYRRRAGGG